MVPLLPMHGAAGNPQAGTGNSLRLQILGPLRIWRDGVELGPLPRRQASLLVSLLAQPGRPVSAHELIDLIWDGDAPALAGNLVQKYVGALRRLLEPGLPARNDGSYLQRRWTSYLFVPGPGMLDSVAFREFVKTADADLEARRREAALDCYLQALDLWRGPVGDGITPTAANAPIFAKVNEEFFVAVKAATELAISLGQPDRVLEPLRLATSMAPSQDQVRSSLIAALAAAGQQPEALAAFHVFRARRAEEPGIDPDVVLQVAHERALNPHLIGPATIADDEEHRARQAPAADLGPRAPTGGNALVGRVRELASLRRAIDAAFSGETATVIIEGEPGVGKTHLMEEGVADASRRGATVVWGRCVEGGAAPSMWPWMQIVDSTLGCLPPGSRQRWLEGDLSRLVSVRHGDRDEPELPDGRAQFRLFEQVVALLARAPQRPIVLALDDLQWADVASLQLLGHLTGRLPAGVVVLGALRDRAPVQGSELTRVLAVMTRNPRHRRVPLEPLSLVETTELVRRESGQEPGPVAARSLHARTGGNPFFVKELSRLFAGRGATAAANGDRLGGLPSTVRDVVRSRMTTLEQDVTDLLHIAGMLGRDIDLRLLARVADLDPRTCLARFERAEALGLIASVADDPLSFRFSHDIIRESIAATVPFTHVPSLHLRIADALVDSPDADESKAERLAHHLWSAGPLAEPSRTVSALVHAGRRAAEKTALHTAEQHLSSAVQVACASGVAELELDALSQLISVLAMRVGYTGPAVERLERAEQLALRLGREREAAEFLLASAIGAYHTTDMDRLARLARRLLDRSRTSADPIVRGYGFNAWAMYQREMGDVGESYRYLHQGNELLLNDPAPSSPTALHVLLTMNWPMWQALWLGTRGNLDAARAILDRARSAAGEDPYAVTLWAYFTALIAAIAGDPAWARPVVERAVALDPERTFNHLGPYLRVLFCWARGLTVGDPAREAADAEAIIAMELHDPLWADVAFYHALAAELALAAGRLDQADGALDQAHQLIGKHGQGWTEGLLLLLRARLSHARGEPASVVRAAAERARAWSAEREANMFARRADRFLTQLDEPSKPEPLI